VIKKKDTNQKDKKTWEEYIKNPTDIYDKEKKNVPEEVERKNRYKFDLHGFTLDEANIKVQEIIKHCIKNKFKELLLITGKGLHSSNNTDVYVSRDLGRLKYSVPEFIKKNSELNKFIVSINDAEKIDGGSGAIIIKLRNL
jgi:DNA-nicking Smr family endonuclease